MNFSTTTIVICLLLAFLFAAYVKHNWRRWKYTTDLHIPFPANPRKGVYYGFYGCQDNQVAETFGSFNLLVEGQFDGHEKCATNILEAGKDTLLYVAGQLFTPKLPGQHCKLHPDAAINLLNFFGYLRSRGALHFVKAICPIDEPNNTVGSVEELAKAILTLRIVCSQFPELEGFKLATFYAADKPFICKDLYDWIGVDDYDMKAHVLVGEKYKTLVRELKPHQSTMIIPGAAYGQDPTPFVNYALGSPEVVALVPFLWFDARNNDVGAPGARSNGMGPAYLAAGKLVIEQ